MKKIDKNQFQLSDGCVIYAYDGYISIGDDMRVMGGYDGNITGEYEGHDVLEVYNPYQMIPLTQEHRAEIADYMIELWTKFKN